MHGGSAPPLVVPATAEVRVEVHPSFAGFDVEIDGHTYPLQALDYRLSLHEEKVTLVAFDEPALDWTACAAAAHHRQPANPGARRACGARGQTVTPAAQS